VGRVTNLHSPTMSAGNTSNGVLSLVKPVLVIFCAMCSFHCAHYTFALPVLEMIFSATLSCCLSLIM
jgi:hypothetical protein